MPLPTPRHTTWRALSIALIVLATLALTVPTATSAELLQTGKGSFLYQDALQRRIIVWYYRPDTVQPNTPVLFVMHGINRNAKDYRDEWHEHAKAQQVILLVPEFSEEAFPGSAHYNLGDVFATSGRLNDTARWGFTSIEHIFDRVRSAARLSTSTYHLYGHSAGAQFVHRMVLFMPQARIKTAVSANAGWYTMPNHAVAFPYGLQDTPVTQESLRLALAQKHIILLGEEDTDEHSQNLRKTPEAMAQGRHRLERGKTFYQAARQAASRLHMPCNWTLQLVPKVSHSNTGMAVAAVALLF